MWKYLFILLNLLALGFFSITFVLKLSLTWNIVGLIFLLGSATLTFIFLLKKKNKKNTVTLKDQGKQIVIYNIISFVIFAGLFLAQAKVPFQIQLGGFMFLESTLIRALVYIWKKRDK